MTTLSIDFFLFFAYLSGFKDKRGVMGRLLGGLHVLPTVEL